MGKRDRYSKHPDPDYQRWGRTYSVFPGVAECVRLILCLQARGAWAEIIHYELARNAENHLDEIIEAFQTNSSDSVATYLLMALESAAVPSSVGFLAEVLRTGDGHLQQYARRALQTIDTPKSRKVLYEQK